MACRSERRAPPAHCETNSSHGEVKAVRCEVVVHEIVNSFQHSGRSRFSFELMERFGINTVGHKRRTNPMTGHIAHQDTESFIAVGKYHSKVAADGTRWIEVGLDRNIAPNQILRRERLLNASSEHEFCFYFSLPLFEKYIRLAKLLLDLLLCADVSHNEQHIFLAVRSLNLSTAKNRRNLFAVSPRKVELISGMPLSLTRFVLLHDVRDVFRREYRIGRASLDLTLMVPAQPRECLVRKDHAKLIIRNDYSLIQLFENTLRLSNPIRGLEIGISHGCIPSSAPLNFLRGCRISDQLFLAGPIFCDVHELRSTG